MKKTMVRKAIRGPTGTIRSGRVLVTRDKFGARGRRKVVAAGSTDFRIRGVKGPRRRTSPQIVQTARRRISKPIVTKPRRRVRVPPPPPQISSRPKPPPRPFIQSDFPRGRSFGEDQIKGNFSGPLQFEMITRPFQSFGGSGKRRQGNNQLFSPISQDVVGFESSLVSSKGIGKPTRRFSTDIFGVF